MEFLKKYKGGIIGIIVAIILLILELDRILIGAVVILAGMLIGNYVQRNKPEVKEKLKRLIDRM